MGTHGAERVFSPPSGRAVCSFAAVVVLASCGGTSAGSSVIPGIWRLENSSTLQRLYDVSCVSALRCEAVGDAGTIVSTSDGGTIWRPQVNPLQGTSTSLYRIACVAPSSCYVIGRPDTILVTHDDGATWSSHVLPLGLIGSSFTDSACLGNYTPISGRPALCRLGLLDIACASALVCYAVDTTPPAYDATPLPATPYTASLIWMTGDGGVSWTRQSVPPGVACDGDCADGRYGYPLVWVSCLSSGECMAGGSNVLGCGHCGFAYAVVLTRGPGVPWACAETAPACTGLAPDAGDCPAITSCYGIQSTNPFGPENVVVRSTDGGASWARVGADWTTSVLNDIACPTARTCYIAGSRGTITQVSSGISVTSEPAPTTSDLYGIGCTGPATCYAVGDGGTILARR